MAKLPVGANQRGSGRRSSFRATHRRLGQRLPVVWTARRRLCHLLGTTAPGRITCPQNYVSAGVTRSLTSAQTTTFEVDRPDRGDRRRRGESNRIDAEVAARTAMSGRYLSLSKYESSRFEVSMASGICPVADSRTAQWRPGVLPAIQLVGGITPLPAIAWVSLDAPGDAPATTAAVAPDTLPGERPPRWMMAVEGSSRLKFRRVPVTTIARPACVSGRASPVSGAGVSAAAVGGDRAGSGMLDAVAWRC